MSTWENTIHHEEQEWEDQRENFTQYYKTENRTLKDAAQCMTEHHNFQATPRQWERKVKVWGLEKYTSRRDRLQQIQSQGRSIHEVARAGRRPQSFGGDLLHPEHGDDRNIRRFARRELNRSTSRSRSRAGSDSSCGRRSRSASPLPDDEPSSAQVVQVHAYDLDFSTLLQSGAMHANPASIPLQVQAVPTDHDSFGAQAHVMSIQDVVTGETSDELFISLPDQSVAEDMMSEPHTLGHQQYDFATLDRRYSIEHGPAPPDELERSTQFPELDTSFDLSQDLMAAPHESMHDISPTFTGPPATSWITPTTLPQHDSGHSQPFNSQPQNFHATPTSDVGPSQDFQMMSTPIMPVPELVFPPSPSPSTIDELNGSSLGNQPQPPISRRDERIYSDFYTSVNRYSQAVIDVVNTSANSSDNRIDILKKLANDLTSESK
jgi:Clr5 domain